MKEPNWKIVFTSQILLMLFVSSVLSFKMGLFEDIKQQIIHEAIAEEPLKKETPVIVVPVIKKVEDKTAPVAKTTKTTAVEKKEDIKTELVEKASVVDDVLEDLDVFARKTDAEVKKIIDKYKDQISDSFIATVTSYNSEAGQTDDSPCITASNMDVCKRNVEDILATNDLPFHTKVLIPEYFGDRVFYVEDRMNQRYTGTDRLDIWMKNKTNSKNFGAKVLKIIVLK